jgi:hypothetical protein
MRCSTLSAAGATVDELLIGFQISRPEVDGALRKEEKNAKRERENICCRKSDKKMT